MDRVTPSNRNSRALRTVVAGLSSSAVVILALPLACDKDLSRDYEFLIRVNSEPGRALAGATASFKGKELAVSDASGAALIKVRGREGDVLPIQVSCPSGHRPPPSAIPVPLRHLGDHVRPEFSAVCTPTTHSLVVAVRADHGPHLPLLHLGRELARTDSSGAAHLVLDVASDDVVDLVLDTSERPRLRPRSPSLRIQSGARDEITAIHQEFSLEPQDVKIRKVAPPKGPVRIQ